VKSLFVLLMYLEKVVVLNAILAEYQSDDTICSFEIKPFNLVIRVPSTKDHFIQVKRGF
jgi:hypothetical protein